MQRVFLWRLGLLLMLLWSVPLLAQSDESGYQIVFSSNRDTGDNWQLYTMNADGSGVTRITNSDTNDYGAVLSPDKTQILYTRRNALGYSEIYALDATGANDRLMTVGRQPAWSPDGENIAYVFATSDNMDIYIMSKTGFDNRQFTTNPARDYAPAWSPDGSLLAFKSTRDGEPYIYTVRLDRSDLRQLAPTDSTTHPPAWSPDGTLLAFTRNIDGQQAIHTVNVETGETRRLSPPEYDDMTPIWTPNGNGIIFTSIVNGQPEIMRMNADGGNRQQLTDNGGWDWRPTIFTPPES